MSLPSIAVVAEELGVNLATATEDENERVLCGAMKRDLGDAVAFLHQKAHDAKEAGIASWHDNPNSTLGKQLIRLHASTAMRHLAQKHFCHGAELIFINCCDGKVVVDGKKKPNMAELVLLQIRAQDGRDASPDC
ncbi:MAG: hypothetical protein EXS60_01300 [Candidatus Pacebacteria bacterium]|nr:hypothetical protein [Candidatus Paceibacterota bacterium]